MYRTNLPKKRYGSAAVNLGRVAAAVFTATVVIGLVWLAIEVRQSNRLGRNTRIVVRVPESVIDRLTADEIQEQFKIDEKAGDLEVTGTALATGRVFVRIDPHPELSKPDDAIITVRVTGETENQLTGIQSSVEMTGVGHGRFEAIKRLHFDGLQFDSEEPTAVEATHETEVEDVEPFSGTPLKGAVKLLASRKARAALPELNQIAVERIEERVRQRVDELVTQTMAELNQMNQFDDTVARLHPQSDLWRIDVTSKDGFVQAALVPDGSSTPVLPADRPETLEVWLRLTDPQRARLNLATRWNRSHTLFKEFLPESQAERLEDSVTVTDVEDWTCLRIGERLDAPEA